MPIKFASLLFLQFVVKYNVLQFERKIQWRIT
nr:MAG TPA: hypothetical protein [Caudoviricetes sp.]